MSYPISRFINGRETHRLTRYLMVGGLSTALDFGALIALKSLGLPTLPANSLSYSAGIANNYTLNRLWTYSDSRSKRVSLQFLQFAVVSICGLLLNNAIVLLLTSWLDLLYDAPSASYLPAKVFATALVLVWTFTANRLWTFNDIR